MDAGDTEDLQLVENLAYNNRIMTEVWRQHPTLTRLCKDEAVGTLRMLAGTGAIKGAKGTLPLEFKDSNLGVCNPPPGETDLTAWRELKRRMQDFLFSLAGSKMQFEGLVTDVSEEILAEWVNKSGNKWPAAGEKRTQLYHVDRTGTTTWEAGALSNFIVTYHVWCSVAATEETSPSHVVKVDITCTLNFEVLQINLKKMKECETMLQDEPYPEVLKAAQKCAADERPHKRLKNGLDIFKLAAP